MRVMSKVGCEVHARTVAKMRRVRVVVIAALVTTIVLTALHKARAAEVARTPVDIPIADFFRHAAVTEAVMSPDGQHIATLVVGGPEKRRRLVVLDLNNLSASKVAAAFNDVDIVRVQWVNDQRLVFSVIDQQSPLGQQWGTGLFAVDRDGVQAPRRLIKSREYWLSEPKRVGDRELGWEHRLDSTLRDGSNDVIVERWLFDSRWEPVGSVLLRLDTVTGLARSIVEGGPADTVGWAIDRRGAARVAVTAKGGRSRLYWRPRADAGEWVMLREFDTYADDARAAHWLAVGEDDRLYGAAPADPGVDTDSLVRLDLQGKALKVQPLLSLAGFDFRGTLVFGSGGDLLGVRYVSDAPAAHWYDPRLAAIQGKVDTLLPSTNNSIDCGQCADPKVVLVASSSDRQPIVYRLFDVASGKLEPLAQQRPWINPALQAVRDMQRFAARDGLSIPVHVTRPRGVKGLAPTVVLVHGGPWARGGSWRWDGESQFLASRGYTVIEPEFRGSTGYGSKLFLAGFKQWGLAMQDDLVDAARWAVQQGFSDPKRICIAGASYGGYATLMGLIRDPDVFRCGVEWVGVSDVELMYSVNWSDMSTMWKDYGMPVMIGDREKDRAQLDATSPLKQAAKLNRPLLMAYGSDDRRVPLTHGTQFRDAVNRSNTDVEFVVYPGEAHGFMLESTNVDFWGRVERFLARHIGPAAAPAAASSP